MGTMAGNDTLTPLAEESTPRASCDSMAPDADAVSDPKKPFTWVDMGEDKSLEQTLANVKADIEARPVLSQIWNQTGTSSAESSPMGNAQPDTPVTPCGDVIPETEVNFKVQVPEKSPDASRKSSRVVIDINDIRPSVRMTHAFSARGPRGLGLVRRVRVNRQGDDDFWTMMCMMMMMLCAFVFMVHSYMRMRAAKVRQALRKGNAIVVVDKDAKSEWVTVVMFAGGVMMAAYAVKRAALMYNRG